MTSQTQADRLKEIDENKKTTTKISKINLKRLNSLVLRSTKRDTVLKYIFDCIDNGVLITKEDILLLGVKNV